MPFGGRNQRTPAQVMAALLPVLPGQETDQASVMAWGFDPEAMAVDPYRGAYDGVVTSLAKLVAAGADYRRAYLTLQEFFEKLRDGPRTLGQALRRPAGGSGRPAGLRRGGHRRQGLHVRLLQRPGRAPHPDLLCHRPHPGRGGAVPRVQGGGPSGVPALLPANGGAQSQREAWETFHELCRRGQGDAPPGRWSTASPRRL